MKFTIETSILQDLISKAVKGAANNKYIDFTNWVNLKCKNNVLTFITSDGSNFFYVNHPINVEDFDVVIGISQFSSLVKLTQTPEITLTIDKENNCIEFKGDGDYTIPLPVDAEFNDPLSTTELNDPTTTIDKTLVSNILSINKPSIAPTMQNPENTGYYVGDKVITTDSKRITVYHENVLENAILLTRSMVDLLSIIDDDKIDCYINKKQVIFRTDKYAIYGYTLSGIEFFKIDAINKLLEQDLDSCAVFNKADILNTLTRIMLFVTDEDNTIKLNFTDKYLTISANTKTKESVTYIQSTNPIDFDCKIKISTLMSQINSLNEETFAFYYGNDKLVKLTTDNITQIIATTL